MTAESIEITAATVKQYGLDAGARMVGIASASDFGLAPEGFKPGDVLPSCQSVVVLAAPHPRDALDSVATYTAMRNEMAKQMTARAQKVAKRLQKQGFEARAVSAVGCKTVDGNSWGAISLKHAAELAGLGMIARNYLLTNEEYGNLLWLSAVLTNAELAPDARVHYDICDGCRICADACSVGALDGYPPALNKKPCRSHFKIVDKKLEIQCFACRTACPHRFGIKPGKAGEGDGNA